MKIAVHVVCTTIKLPVCSRSVRVCSPFVFPVLYYARAGLCIHNLVDLLLLLTQEHCAKLQDEETEHKGKTEREMRHMCMDVL